MPESVLLTDDEIIALCAIDGRPWPLGLITVEATAVEVARAGMRGMRSLLVREYVREGDGETPEPDPLLARYIATFLESPVRVGAYVAPATEPSTLGGASVTAAKSEDGWILDSATAAGVHAIRAVSAEEAYAAVTAMVAQAERGTLFAGEADPSRWICATTTGGELTVANGDGSALSLVRDAVLGGGQLSATV
ncbi:hypothetical protein [Mycolicibacterium austroafricanum]|uniref:ESX secretion-associated protein EspG n=1 Tax=Mycolicibacterium austroafricanum TaxID=39687 RepID=A0ABT8HKJ3_MYCAO|nr:hypothetical protein [Mycolicibacterium austroafricanum]MDN4521284.1 hypothetical protein [Mycolicibacterium austroafricanum]QRZ08171.1 hypothetical protein JN090_06450 [Mycolicibacterium austroafricanum]